MTVTAPTALYRFFDADDALLYVGITGNLIIRWRQHAETKAWWKDIARYSVELIGDRAEAEAAEKAAVRAEKPKHNRAHVIKAVKAVNPLPADRPDELPVELDLSAMLDAAERSESKAEAAQILGVVLSRIPDLAEYVRQDRQRVVAELHDVEGLSWAEIGEAIGQHRTRAAQIARGVAGGDKRRKPEQKEAPPAE